MYAIGCRTEYGAEGMALHSSKAAGLGWELLESGLHSSQKYQKSTNHIDELRKRYICNLIHYTLHKSQIWRKDRNRGH
jgi:hypothetical protein